MSDWTQVPNAWDALVALFTAAFVPDATVAVYDGPATTDLADRYVQVGVDPAVAASGGARQGLPAVSGVQDISSMGNEEVSEQFEIRCGASVYSGDTDAAAARRATLGLFNACAAAVANNRSLGGVIVAPGKATIGRFEWYLEQYTDGCTATVGFSVMVPVEFVNWQGR